MKTNNKVVVITKQYVNGNFAHIIVHIKFTVAHFLLQSLNKPLAIPIECSNKTLQHKLMEGWRNQFTMRTPFFSMTYQQTITEPEM